jgi:hypothetical protein
MEKARGKIGSGKKSYISKIDRYPQQRIRWLLYLLYRGWCLITVISNALQLPPSLPTRTDHQCRHPISDLDRGPF